MTATTQCFTPFRADRIRITRLDSCGVPVVGAKSTVVTDGLISVEGKASIDSGNDVKVKNAKGKIKVSSRAKPSLDYVDVTLTLTGVDPDLYEIFTGQQLITDGQGNAIGISVEEYIDADFGAALETWTEIGTDDGDCGPDGKLYGYFLLPQLVHGQIGDVTLNDGAMDCVLTGSTKRGSGWGTGPASYLVQDGSADGTAVVPAVLSSAVTATEHWRMFTTPVAPPAVACGATALA